MMDVENKKEDKFQKAQIKEYAVNKPIEPSVYSYFLCTPGFALLTPELVTLAQQLANREKTKTQLINDGFKPLFAELERRSARMVLGRRIEALQAKYSDHKRSRGRSPL